LREGSMSEISCQHQPRQMGSPCRLLSNRELVSSKLFFAIAAISTASDFDRVFRANGGHTGSVSVEINNGFSTSVIHLSNVVYDARSLPRPHRYMNSAAIQKWPNVTHR